MLVLFFFHYITRRRRDEWSFGALRLRVTAGWLYEFPRSRARGDERRASLLTREPAPSSPTAVGFRCAQKYEENTRATRVGCSRTLFPQSSSFAYRTIAIPSRGGAAREGTRSSVSKQSWREEKEKINSRSRSANVARVRNYYTEGGNLRYTFVCDVASGKLSDKKKRYPPSGIPSAGGTNSGIVPRLTTSALKFVRFRSRTPFRQPEITGLPRIISLFGKCDESLRKNGECVYRASVSPRRRALRTR